MIQKGEQWGGRRFSPYGFYSHLFDKKHKDAVIVTPLGSVRQKSESPFSPERNGPEVNRLSPGHPTASK